MTENKFQLVKEIGQGAIGLVWLAIDQSTHQKCAVKIMDLCEEFRVEEKIYKLLHRREYIGFPRFLSSGVDNFKRGYLAIEVLGPSLKNILQHQKHRISPQTSLQLGIQLVSIISQLHKIGFVHRDLKLDNILLRSFDFSSPESSLISIIDFSASQTYLCENGRHIQNERQSTFIGNFVFSSVYQMLGHSPSRKDDLLSIFYLLLYFKDGKLPWVIKQNDGKIKTMSFDQVRKAKQDFHSEIKMKSQTCLIRCLIKYCDKLQFEEKPRYDIIIKNLLTQLNSLNTIKEQWAMDWTKLTSNWCNRMVEFSEQFKYFENPISQKMKKISGESSNGGRNFSTVQGKQQYINQTSKLQQLNESFIYSQNQKQRTQTYKKEFNTFYSRIQTNSFSELQAKISTLKPKLYTFEGKNIQQASLEQTSQHSFYKLACQQEQIATLQLQKRNKSSNSRLQQDNCDCIKQTLSNRNTLQQISQNQQKMYRQIPLINHKKQRINRINMIDLRNNSFHENQNPKINQREFEQQQQENPSVLPQDEVEYFSFMIKEEFDISEDTLDENLPQTFQDINQKYLIQLNENNLQYIDQKQK